jgi:SAM-dependent methyltransferase
MGEMVRVLRPGGYLYLHTPNRWACFESHYKIFWLPGLPSSLQRAYLTLRGRPTAFLDTLRLLSPGQCRRLVEAAGARVARALHADAPRPVGGPLWPLVRLYYRLFGIHPYVELLAVRETEP